MKVMRALFLFLIVIPGAGVRAEAAQTSGLLDELFQDHAVLQRDKPIGVWGQGVSGEVVTVSLGAASVTAHADAAGHWTASLPAMQAGGPYVLSARGSSGVQQSGSDILIGDVFLCSGQSNMEMQVLRARDSYSEIQGSANNTIRMLTVAHATSPAPNSRFAQPVHWEVAGPSTVPDWSAVCFYFARELQKSVHVPVGLVHSSWGGSNIRPWMSATALRAMGGYDASLRLLDVYAKDPAAAQADFARQWEQWWRGQTGDRAGHEPWNEPWNARGSAGSWREAPAGLGNWREWHNVGLEDFAGLVWYRTRVTLTPAQAKSAVGLALGPINQMDETWVNGHALGNTFGYGTERTYSIPAGVLHAGENTVVVNVGSTWGGGGLLAGGTPRAVHLADGQSVPLQGPWEYRTVPTAVGFPQRAPWESVGGLTTIYNAMIAPLGAFGFRGVLWYQGESNAGEADTYQGLLSGLMADWRRQFGPELPFLIVQLPNFGTLPTAPTESGWAMVREAQRLAVANDSHAGLAVTIDLGEPDNLHPTNKQDIGKRLARAARHVIYGESLPPSGPVPVTVTRDANRVAVEFSGVERGLVAYSHDNPIAFELCGEPSGSCRFVESRIDGNRVLLTVPDGLSPARVRYCWADSPVCTLFDRSGLPAGPFELRIRQ